MRKTGLTLALYALGICLYGVSCQSGGGQGRVLPPVTEDGPANIALTRYADSYPAISVVDTVHDFGTITQGDVVQCNFRFKNTGTKPLIISDASSTCGCTVPDYPRSPVAPGKEGILKVVFNSAHKMGKQVKPIFIQSNTMPKSITLKIVCLVTENKL